MTQTVDQHQQTETPLSRMTRENPQTALWNDSSHPVQLHAAIGWGAVGATCNPVIALAVIKADLPRWTARIREIAAQRPTARHDEIGWAVVE
ncbi:MAG TPA: transaldolase, partial [Pengzhenrongella sp.]